MVAIALACLVSPQGKSADHGSIAGIVTDAQGLPLMGATVQISGPVLRGLSSGGKIVERIITDAHGRFAVERLLPGTYSVQVTSATRLPVLRNGIYVGAGRSVQQSFVLADILTPIRLRVPSGDVMSWGESWKWVLRTSAATRPVLRFQEEAGRKSKAKKDDKSPLPPTQHLIAMNPGSSRGRALAGDPGMGSVVAYIRPLSENSDLLVAGSLGTTGLQSSSVATILRREVMKGDPQEIAVAIHQLDFSDSSALAARNRLEGRNGAQALSASYSQTRRVLKQLILTAGFEFDYLNAGQDAMSARPFMKAEYELSPESSVAVRHGAARLDRGSSLLDRVGALTSFPRVTMHGFKPQLERLNHSRNRLHSARRQEFEGRDRRVSRPIPEYSAMGVWWHQRLRGTCRQLSGEPRCEWRDTQCGQLLFLRRSCGVDSETQGWYRGFRTLHDRGCAGGGV